MTARRIQLLGVEAGGQLPGRTHLEAAMIADEEFEALDSLRITRTRFCKRRDVAGKVHDERRIDHQESCRADPETGSTQNVQQEVGSRKREDDAGQGVGEFGGGPASLHIRGDASTAVVRDGAHREHEDRGRRKPAHSPSCSSVDSVSTFPIDGPLDVVAGPGNVVVVTAAGYETLTRDQLPGLPAENLLLEPSGLAAAALFAGGRNPRLPRP